VANDIAHWRAQIFARLLLVVFLLGLATAVPSVLLAISEGMWSIAVVDSVALVWIGVIWRWRSLAYTARVVNFLPWPSWSAWPCCSRWGRSARFT
jgi:hypothetical protein